MYNSICQKCKSCQIKFFLAFRSPACVTFTILRKWKRKGEYAKSNIKGKTLSVSNKHERRSSCKTAAHVVDLRAALPIYSNAAAVGGRWKIKQDIKKLGLAACVGLQQGLLSLCSPQVK